MPAVELALRSSFQLHHQFWIQISIKQSVSELLRHGVLEVSLYSPSTHQDILHSLIWPFAPNILSRSRQGRSRKCPQRLLSRRHHHHLNHASNFIPMKTPRHPRASSSKQTRYSAQGTRDEPLTCTPKFSMIKRPDTLSPSSIDH